MQVQVQGRVQVQVQVQVQGQVLPRIADARYSSWDRLYYNSLFSVVVLAPAR